jgi:hypothetical protein
MPYFEVMLHAHGIDLPIDGENRSIGGFYANRVVKVANADVAERIASELLATEWLSGPHAALNRGAAPRIEVDSVSEVSFLRGLFGRRTGYVFYPREEQ